MSSKRCPAYGFERLEDRAMMAGDVTTAVDGDGNLVLTGDTASNHIQVRQISDTEWEVRGSRGTTVDGGTAAVIVADVTAGILADLGEGHDSIKLTGDVAADLNIVTDGGNDSVRGYELTVAGNLIVDTGEGHDNVSLGDLDVAGELGIDIDTDGGHDLVALYSATALVADIDTGDGHDLVGLSRIDILGNLTVATGLGNDHVGLLRATIDGSLTAEMGDGRDVLGLFNTDVAVDAVLEGGDDGSQDRLLQLGFTAGNDLSNGFELGNFRFLDRLGGIVGGMV